MKIPPVYRGLAKVAEKQGWVITMSAGNHLRWRSPAGGIVITSSSPSCHRALQNARSLLRRNGLKV